MKKDSSFFPEEEFDGSGGDSLSLPFLSGGDNIIGQIFSGGAQIVKLGQLLKAQLTDIAASGEAIKDQLTQLQVPARTVPVLRWSILDMAAPLATDPTLRGDLRTPTSPGHVLTFSGRAEILKARLHFGMSHQCLLDHLLQCNTLLVGLLRIHGRLGHTPHGQRGHTQSGYHLCNLTEFHCYPSCLTPTGQCDA